MGIVEYDRRARTYTFTPTASLKDLDLIDGLKKQVETLQRQIVALEAKNLPFALPDPLFCREHIEKVRRVLNCPDPSPWVEQAR